MKITIRKDMQDFLKDPLLKAGYEIYLEGEKDSYDSEMFIGYPSSNLHNGTYPNLKTIQLLSAGYDGLDLERLKEEKITVMNARGVYSEPIAEFVLANILYSMKDLDILKSNQDKKEWNRSNALPLSLIDKKVFLLGTGSINEEVAKRLHVFKAQTIGFNSDGRDLEHFDLCHPLSQMPDMIHEADIIVASLPSNKHTIHLFNGALFDKIKENAIFVNVGRGSLLDEKDIQNHTKHLKKIILDVFEEEPLSKDSYLWEEENVVITPHISFFSERNNQNRLDLVFENIKRLKNKQSLKNQIL